MAQKQSVARRHQKMHAHTLSVLKAICVITVLLVLLMIAAYRFGNITFSSVGDYFSTMISNTKRGDGYPYYFENTKVKAVLPIGSDLFAVGEDATFVLDRTARKLGNTPHTFSAPVAYSSGGRVLLLDVGENAYRVMSKTKILYEGVSPQKLLTGAIGKDGTIALAMRGADSQSALTVLDKNQKAIFSWSCASENIVAAAVSDNGKRIAVAAIGAENGELYTKVHLFDIRKSEPVLSKVYSETISGLEFLAGNRLLVYGKNRFTMFENDKICMDEELSLNTLSRFFACDRNTAVAVLSKYGSAASKIIRAYNRAGELQFEIELEESVKGVSCDSLYVSVLTDRFLYTYNYRGEQVGKSAVNADCMYPITDGKRTYIYTMRGVECKKSTAVSAESQTGDVSEP